MAKKTEQKQQTIQFWDDKCKFFDTSALGDNRGPGSMMSHPRDRIVGSATYLFVLDKKELTREKCVDKDPKKRNSDVTETVKLTDDELKTFTSKLNSVKCVVRPYTGFDAPADFCGNQKMFVQVYECDLADRYKFDSRAGRMRVLDDDESEFEEGEDDGKYINARIPSDFNLRELLDSFFCFAEMSE